MAVGGRDAVERPGRGKMESRSLEQLLEENTKLWQELASLRERIEQLERRGQIGSARPLSAGLSTAGDAGAARAAEPAGGSSLPPPLNRALLNDLRELQQQGAPDMVTRMIDAYMGSVPKTRESLRQAIDGHDPEGLRQSAHSLKSSSANLGATRLSELCRKLEYIGRGGSTAHAETLLDDFESEYERVRVALLAEKGRGAE